MTASLPLLVTGAKGFIGSSILDSDKFVNGREILIYEEVVKGEILDSEKIRRSTLLHLAGKYSGTDEELWKSNVENTRTVIKNFKQMGGTKIVYFSSGAVYGSNTRTGGALEEDAVSPVNYYGFVKSIAEEIVQYEAQSDGLKWHVLRLPNVYGADQQKGVVYQMLRQISEKNLVSIEGDGTQMRDYLHITDLLLALELLLNSDAENGIYNVTSHARMSVNELVERISAKKEVMKTYSPKINLLQNLILDGSKAQRTFSFSARVNNIIFD